LVKQNSAPRPDGKTEGAQAVALRTSGDKSAFYNCQFFGFQDTVCDDRHNHFFKDCLIQGTVDYIFGSGRSLYLVSDYTFMKCQSFFYLLFRVGKYGSSPSEHNLIDRNIFIYVVLRVRNQIIHLFTSREFFLRKINSWVTSIFIVFRSSIIIRDTLTVHKRSLSETIDI
jgi:hypothetical protein